MSNGTAVIWTGIKRDRRAEVITAMKCSPPHCHLVRVVEGLPGERGRCFVVPTSRLRNPRESSR
jgi:hypothetical protein